MKRLRKDENPGMRFITGGAFSMGCETFYPEEAPVRPVVAPDFWIDEAPVTNAQFGRFVRATGYRTFAERVPDPVAFPDMPADRRVPGSLVFTPPSTAPDLSAHETWWAFVPGANWQAPLGPGSDLKGLGDHPVVHVTYGDALAYARWAGKDLATEAEWEFAAKGGLDGKAYAWGDDLAPDGFALAKIWSGIFPHINLAPPGLERTAPVKSFPPNGFGLHDMIGNVWELTGDLYTDPGMEPAKACCSSRRSLAPLRRVAKGGSHLCAPNYCRRYRPAGRIGQTEDTSTSHMGFRCVKR